MSNMAYVIFGLFGYFFVIVGILKFIKHLEHRSIIEIDLFLKVYSGLANIYIYLTRNNILSAKFRLRVSFIFT